MSERSHRIGIAALLLLIVVFFHPVFFGGKVLSSNDIAYQVPPYDQAIPDGIGLPHNPLLADQVQQFHAYRHHQLENVRRYRWPRWMPHILCGNSFAGNILSQAWYPFIYLGLFLSEPVAETLTRILECLIAGIGMMLFLRKAAGVAPGPSILGAVAFMFCSYRIVWLNHPHASSFSYLPLLLLCVDTLVVRSGRSLRVMLACSILAFLTIAGGHPQSFFYCLLFVGIYGLYRVTMDAFSRKQWQSCLRPAASVAIGLGAGVLLAAVILLPFADALYTNSYTYGDRAGFALRGTVPARAFIHLIVPRWFGTPIHGTDQNVFNYNENAMFVGVTILWCIIAALPSARRNRHFVFFLGSAVAIVAVLIGVPVISSAIRGLPLIRDMPAMRMTMLMQGCLAAAGAIGLHELVKGRRSGGPPHAQRWHIATGILMAMACITVYALSPSTADAHRFAATTACVAVLLLLVTRANRFLPAWTALLVAVLFAELFSIHATYNPTMSPEDAVLPEPAMVSDIKREMGDTWFRVAGLDGTLSPNYAIYHALNDVRGYDLPLPRRYVDFLRYGFYEGAWDYGMIYWHCGGADFVRDRNRRLLELMGIHYLMVEGVAYLLQEDHYRPYPYAYVAGSSVPSSGDPATDAELLRDADTHVVERPSSHLDAIGTNGVVRVVSRNVNGAVLHVSAVDPVIVAINEMPLLGWKARVDGEKADVFGVNMIHAGARVPPGEHTVEFTFFPDSFALGLVVSGCTLAMLIAAGFISLNRNEVSRSAMPIPGDPQT